MTFACARARIGVLVGALSACTVTSELLPTVDAPSPETSPADAQAATDTAVLAYCPTTIDVYGGANMALVGCGGTSQGPLPIEGGFADQRYSDAGTREYANTMAGRLQARLLDDPDLVPTFGRAWQVRSCATPMETLSTLVAPLSDDACGSEEQAPMGTLADICSDQPAPLILVSAGALDDRCHGGGPDSSLADDPATFALHFAQRLEALLASRGPKTAIVGPQTEWYPLEGQGGPSGGPAGGPVGGPTGGSAGRQGCAWQRPEWASLGLAAWRTSHPDAEDVTLVGDLHDDFKMHSACCQALSVSCDTNWLSSSGPGQGVVNCDGAQALVDFWYASLKAHLLAHRFACP
jgi:hypothetical protein